MRAQEVENSFKFDSITVEKLKHDWNQLMALSVWGDLEFEKIGALPRFRKRILEVGENLRSLFSDRSWIPQPREQLKSALGSSLKLRDSLTALERAAVLMSGGQDFRNMETLLLSWRQAVLSFIETYEIRWAEMLDNLHGRDEEE